ncbi:MAG: polysaccharide deacetylase family protein [Anaerolineae bacterium]|nr:polysaccharide deacetylase family protein [Anaerolineae bacterium]
MNRYPPIRPGRAGLVGLIILALTLFVVAALAGCGRPRAVEPAVVPAQPGLAPAATTTAATAVAPMLPTPAATLRQPFTPTPAAIGAAVDSLQATQTAAVSPPTPEITVVADTSAVAAPIDVAAPAGPLTQALPTPSGTYSWTLMAPILMYHYISDPPADADVYRLDLSVTPDNFRDQLAWLRDNGYTAIDYYDLTMAIVGYSELPEKPVLLTFDDGYLDNYTNAFPLLQEYGFKGTFFVITEFIDSGREGYMTWPMIEEMARAGHRIESHSRTHPDLTEKDRDGLIWELLGSQQTIAAHIGYTPRYFCYPGGDYNEQTIALLRELDFWGAVTTANDTWHGFNERFEWGRLRVRNDTTLAELAQITDLQGTTHGKRPEDQ